MQLFVRGLEFVESLEVQEDANIADVKAQIAQLHGFNTEEITLNCEGHRLSNETLISTLTSFELDVTMPMKGGKFHGSLPRADKARGQQEEEQENKNIYKQQLMFVRGSGFVGVAGFKLFKLLKPPKPILKKSGAFKKLEKKKKKTASRAKKRLLYNRRFFNIVPRILRRRSRKNSCLKITIIPASEMGYINPPSHA